MTLKALIAVGFGFGLVFDPMPAQAKCELSQIIELPVTMDGLRPMISASINGHAAQFVADSGAFFSIITPGTAASDGLRLSPAPQNFRLMGVGGEAEASVTTVKDFGLAGHSLHNVEFLVGGSAVGGGAGLIGQNILGLADADYDLAHGVIRLLKPSGCGDAVLAYWAGKQSYSVLNLYWRNSGGKHIEADVMVDGAKIHAMFDTGAPTSVLSLKAAERAGITPDSPGITDGGPTGGLGRHVVQSWIGSFKSLKLGDNEEIKNIKLRFADLGDVDMLIGADFFLSHHVYVGNAEHKMFITYNGGPVFDLSLHQPDGSEGAASPSGSPAAAKAVGATSGSADQLSRDGAALAARHEYRQALTMLDRAVALEPQNARYLYQRASVEQATGDDKKARADLDHALSITPQDVPALMLRTRIAIGQHDLPAARKDADALAGILAKQADNRFALAQLYDAMDAPEAAIAQYGLWIDAHPNDSRLPIALNDRCWLRDLAGTDLEAALDDCDRALRLRPHTANYLDSRGLAHLRMGAPKRAIKDYDEALSRNPKLASSLYGRGIARHQLGMGKQGDADIAAARAIDPDVVDLLNDHGIGR